jgi:regulator of protease activity HflC (stomatin/prohibitin superfamily)
MCCRNTLCGVLAAPRFLFKGKTMQCTDQFNSVIACSPMMGGTDWGWGWHLGLSAIATLVGLILLYKCFDTVPQAHAAVLTVFGKYRRVIRSGLNAKAPWERVEECLSLQKQSMKLEFQAITNDQANIQFATMVLFGVAASDDETIQKAVFCFIDEDDFYLALKRTIEGSVRQFVATVKQSDILGMRSEIVDHTKANIDRTVLEWGYTVYDIQVTDMGFDESITTSMARVVASKNLLAAAANEGAALLVKRTKDAEAEAAYKTIGAEAEKKAAGLRGEGLAMFRKNIAEGMKDAADSLHKAGVDANFLLFLEYTDALKYVADHAQGNVIYMDNGAGAPSRIMQGVLAANIGEAHKGAST